MIESSLATIKHEEVAKPDDKSLTHWLTNAERLDSSVQPLQRLRDMEENAYEELVQVWAYMCIKADGKYAHVHRVGGAGDKGRDVIAYYDGAYSIFDLYQCKHQSHLDTRNTPVPSKYPAKTEQAAELASYNVIRFGFCFCHHKCF